MSKKVADTESDKECKIPSKSENIWVKLDTLKDAAIDEVSENSDLLLVVGDIDIKPVEQTYKPRKKYVLNDKQQTKPLEVVTGTSSLYKYCDNCNYKTKSKPSLKYHMKVNHLNTEPYKCDFCLYTTRDRQQIKGHIKTQHKTFECTLCTYKTIIKRNFSLHKKMHRIAKKKRKQQNQKTPKRIYKPKTILQCDKCPYRTPIASILTRHIKYTHENCEMKCEYCDFVTGTELLMKNHNTNNQKDYVIKCQDCDFESWYACEYKQHRKTHPDKNDNQVHDNTYYNQEVVIIDGKEYPRKPDPPKIVYEPNKLYLINNELHLVKKNISVKQLPNNRYQCTICAFHARKKIHVRFHVLRNHTKYSQRPLLCLYCDFSAKVRDHMRTHMISSKQTNELLQCSSCTFTTRFKCLLGMHERLHKPYECSVCDQRFDQIKKLKKHYKRKHEAPELKCDLCDFTTFVGASMKIHQQRHTGEKYMEISYSSFPQSDRDHM